MSLGSNVYSIDIIYSSLTATTECCGRLVNTYASYTGGKGFKSRRGDRLSWQRFFLGFSQSVQAKYLAFFLPYPFKFIIHTSPLHSTLYSLSHWKSVFKQTNLPATLLSLLIDPLVFTSDGSRVHKFDPTTVHTFFLALLWRVRSQCWLPVPSPWPTSTLSYPRPDDGGSTHLWNVGKLRGYSAQYPRRLIFGCFLPLFLLKCFPIKRLNDVIKATVIIMIIYLVW
jgi:hypothetical protein